MASPTSAPLDTPQPSSSLSPSPPPIKIGLVTTFNYSVDYDWARCVYQVIDAWRIAHVASNASYHPSVRAVEVVITESLDRPVVPSVMGAIKSITDAVEDGIVASMGTGYSNTTVYAAAEFGLHNLPLCDGAATSPLLSDPVNYPLFFRTLAQDNLQAVAILAFISDQGWSTFALMAGSELYATGIANLLVASAPDYNLTISVRADFNDDETEFYNHLALIKSTQSTIIVYTGDESFVWTIMAEAYHVGMLGYPYTWLTTDSARTPELTSVDPVIVKAANGLINFFPMEGYGPVHDDFMALWSGLNTTVYDEVLSGRPQAYTLFYLTCFQLFIRGFDAIIKAHPEAVPTGNSTRWNLTQYVDVPQSFSFPDLVTETGSVVFDKMGDRLGSYSIAYLNSSAYDWYEFAQYDVKDMIYTRPVLYGGGSTVKPPAFITECSVGYGRYSNGHTITCLPCPKGTYSIDPRNLGTCLDCPADATCPGGEAVNVAGGFWATASNVTAVTPTVNVYRCPMPLTCCPSGSCTAEDVCAEGLTGLLCTECEDPMAYVWNSKCHLCNAGLGYSFWLLIPGCFIGAIAMLLVPSEESPAVESLLFHFQVVSYILGPDLAGAGGGPAGSWISALFAAASLNVDGVASDCPAPLRGLHRLMFRYLLPSLLLSNVTIIYAVLRWSQSVVPGAARVVARFAPRYLKGEALSIVCLRAVITTLMFALMPMVETSLTIIQCDTVEGREVVSAVPQILCLSKPHIPAFVLAICILVLLLGAIPLLVSLRLRWMWSRNAITYAEDASPSQKLLMVLYGAFKPDFFYFLPVTIVERGALCIIFTLTGRFDVSVQRDVHLVIIAFLCQTRVYTQPYLHPLLAYLNRELCLSWLVMVGLRSYLDAYPPSSGAATVWATAQICIVTLLPLALHLARWALTRGSFVEVIRALGSSSTIKSEGH
ncbi:Metabotropic GABA-B receptor subtype 3A [Irineochytrium annulatum]|nr:Metabotropic GABA-B receptor subtype 3A [Irineochytrium annulatum]